MLINKLNSKISKFSEKDKKSLIDYFIQSSLNYIFNDTLISNKKFALLNDIKNLNNEIYENNKHEILKHKSIQTRALILDLINTDYYLDIHHLYKPDKWIYEILNDIKISKIQNDLLLIYNEYLINEFEDIFLNDVQLYNSGGNQLLINFMFYKKVLLNEIKYNFDVFISRIKKQIQKEKLMNDNEINIIVEDSYNEYIKYCRKW